MTASFAQHAIWLNERLGLAHTTYHLPICIRFDGDLDLAALRQACVDVVQRHPSLAGTIQERDGVVFVVPGEGVVAGRDGVAITGLAGHGVEPFIAQRFDLQNGPLIRFGLAELAPATHVLVIVAHHVVFDGMSKDVLIGDLAAAYRGEALGPHARPLDEWVAAEDSRVAALLPQATTYWASRWREPASLVVPGLRRTPRGAEPGRSLDIRFADVVVGGSADNDLVGGSADNGVDRVDAAADKIGVSAFVILLAALQVVLYSYGNAETVVAIDLSTRTDEVRDRAGLFVNELPVFGTPPRGDQTFADFARSLRADLRELYRYRSVPLTRAVGGLGARAAMAPVSLSFRTRAATPSFGNVAADVDWAVFNGSARNALHLQAVAGPGGLAVNVQFSPDAIDEASVAAVAARLQEVVRAIVEAPDLALAELLAIGPVAAVGAASIAIPALPLAEQTSARVPSAVAVAGAGATSTLARQVADIWQEVLHIDDIGPDEDLFELGGHSLTITQIMARIRKNLGVEVPFDVFFDTPTVAGVVSAIEHMTGVSA